MDMKDMTMNRYIHFLLAVVMLAVPSVSKAFMVDGIEYIFFDDLTAAVSDCVDNDTVRIPSHVTYEGKTYTVTCIRDFYNPYLHNYEWCKTVHVSLPNTVKTIEDEAFKDALKLRSIELGDSIVTIGASAFEKCWVMDSIKIPDTVTSLGKRAFATCWHLTHLDLSGTSINDIGEETFEACLNLETVDLPGTVSSIGRNAFASSALRHITLPNGLKSLEWGAFVDCDSLESVTLPESLTTINDLAFGECGRLKELFIPRSVNYIASGFISGCDSLMSLAVDPENPTYDSRSDCNAIILTSEDKLITGCPATVIPEGVSAIGDYAFMGINLPATFTLPQTIQSIGDNAFRGNVNLVDIVIPNATQWIGEKAFLSCRSLTSLTLPYALSHIGYKAFSECQNLRTVFAYPTEPIAIDDSMFETISYDNAVLHVPVGCAEKYRVANGWKRFMHIIDDIILPDPADVNGDGEVTIADANKVTEVIINGGGGGHSRIPDGNGGFIEVDDTYLADVNGDGEVSIADLNLIIDRILRGY